MQHVNTQRLARRRPYPVRLSPHERRRFRSMLRRGTHNARVLIRVRILLLADEGTRDTDTAGIVGCARGTVFAVRKRFHDRGSAEAAIMDAPRSGQLKRLTPEHEAFVIATACTTPPPGHAHGSTAALKEELLTTYADLDDIGDETIRKLLVAHHLKPWREKNVVHPPSHAFVPRTDGGRAHAVHAAPSSRA